MFTLKGGLVMQTLFIRFLTQEDRARGFYELATPAHISSRPRPVAHLDNRSPYRWRLTTPRLGDTTAFPWLFPPALTTGLTNQTPRLPRSNPPSQAPGFLAE